MGEERDINIQDNKQLVPISADGIAMGSASSAGSQLELQILVFVAIMLHKVLNFSASLYSFVFLFNFSFLQAPTAFALVSILLASGLDKARVRRHLLIFSLAAPLGTVLTYAFLHAVGPFTVNIPDFFFGLFG